MMTKTMCGNWFFWLTKNALSQAWPFIKIAAKNKSTPENFNHIAFFQLGFTTGQNLVVNL